MIKKYAFFPAIVFFAILFTIAGVVSAETVPEFDGAYLKTTDGKYTEIKITKAFYTAVARQGQDLMEVLSLKPGPYVADKSSLPTFRASAFKGFFLKGTYKFEFFSLHPLRERILKENEIFYENHGPAQRNQPFYVPGDQIELRQKAIDQNSYYFEPREGLSNGEYVGWIGNNLWLFRLE